MNTEYSFNPSKFVASFRLLEEELKASTENCSLQDITPPADVKSKLVVASVQLHTSPTSSSPSPSDATSTDAKDFWTRAQCAVEKAATDQGATLILLQELFLGPYFCQCQDGCQFALAQDLSELDDEKRWKELSSNVFLAQMQIMAKKFGVVLPVSLFERSNNAFYNSVVMVDSDGCVVGRYRKTHIPDGTGYQEKFYFTPGDTGFKVFPTKVGKVGVAICWDQWFPECARSMALMGADIILYPTAIGSEPQDPTLNSADHWQRTMQGHAAANMVPVVAANRIGTEILLHNDGTERQRITFYGRSFITDETGAIIKEAKSEGMDGDIIVAEVDTEKNRETRSAWGLFRDRRPELYGILKTKDGKNVMYGL